MRLCTFPIKLGLQPGQLPRAAAAAPVHGNPPRRARHLVVHSQGEEVFRRPLSHSADMEPVVHA